MRYIRYLKPVPYEEAVRVMDEIATQVYREESPETVLFLEHPSVYIGGRSAKAEEIFNPFHLPVYESARGGRWTYHGPGQLIVYVICNLQKRGGDVHAYVEALQSWVIGGLRDHLHAQQVPARHPEHVGVWVAERKIAAIGVRVRRGITTHGTAINVNPDLRYFTGIIPCGIRSHAAAGDGIEEAPGVTSLHALGGHGTVFDLADTMQRLDLENYLPAILRR